MVAIVKEPAHVTAGSQSAHVPVDATSDAQWDAFVAHHGVPQFLQSSAWATLKSRFGWQATRALVTGVGGRDGAPVGGASILLRRAVGITLAYVPRGPVVDWRDAGVVRVVMAAVAEEARQPQGRERAGG
jgi:serine/alanine adding enzyme